MREGLRPDTGVRKKFRAVFRRFGKRVNYHGYADQTILLEDVRDGVSNLPVTDHVWFAYTKGFEAIGLKTGMIIEFEARVKRYKKGYVNRKINIDHRREDFKLSHPTRITIVRA